MSETERICIIRISQLIMMKGRFFALVREEVLMDIQWASDQLEPVEDERVQTARLIQLINTPGNLGECMAALTSFLQRWSACEAVGIRLRSGDDYPYYETRGFPPEFVEAEKFLCAHDSNGKVLLDSEGCPVLECMCGNILNGSFDPAKPYFTSHGSFWSNSTSLLLEGNAQHNVQKHTRNRCFTEGYESMALIPMRIGKQVFGLLQFNDHQPDRFTPAMIRLFEEMADGLSLSLSRRQSEEALARSEHALKRSQRLLAETERIGKVGGWEFYIDSANQTWTDEVYAIHEVDQTYDPTVEKWIEFCTPVSRPVIEQALQRIVDFGRPFEVELEIITANNNLRNVNVIGKADPENRRIHGFMQDITVRKLTGKFREMVREILQILNAHGNLEELIPHVLETLKTRTGFDAVGIRLQDGDDFPYIVQDGFSADFLLVENTLIERSCDGGICRDKDGRVSLECTCGLVLSGKTDPGNPLFTAGGSCWTNDSFSLLEIPPDADPRFHPRNECIHQGYASVALVPIRDGGKIVGLIQFNDRRKDCFTLDTVERFEEIATYIGAVLMRKRIEDEKLALEQQYQQARRLESLGVLSGGIAHDFNNILAIITGHCFLARMVADNAENSIAEIEKAAERAAELCRQMLAYAGKTQFVPVQFSLGELVAEMLKMLRPSLKQGVEIKFELFPGVPIIKGDANQFRHVIMSLVSNALEAIGESSGEVRVLLTGTQVRAEQPVRDHQGVTIPPGCYACLEVADNGCGMSVETLRRIFDPFFTTKFTGRGLGLSATLGIITSHGGSLQLYSQQGKGTTFKLYLPVPVAAPVEAKTVNDNSESWRGSGTVLLAEDERQVRLVAKTLLESLGFKVIEAANGLNALELYRKNSETVTLVLTDMGMPVMDGYELFRELNKLDPSLPVIISSGFSDDAITSKISCENIAGLLSKPYKFEQLRETLKKVMEEITE